MDEKMDTVKQKKTFSGDVIQRMLSDVEFEAFWQKYKATRGTQGMRNRFQTERPALSDTESKFLYEYLNETGKTGGDLAEQYGINKKSVSSYAMKLMVRAVWLNKEKLDF